MTIDHSIIDYIKGVYEFLESTGPQGFAEEAFRLPPAATRAQQALFAAIQGNSCGERPTPARQDKDDGSTNDRGVFA